MLGSGLHDMETSDSPPEVLLLDFMTKSTKRTQYACRIIWGVIWTIMLLQNYKECQSRHLKPALDKALCSCNQDILELIKFSYLNPSKNESMILLPFKLCSNLEIASSNVIKIKMVPLLYLFMQENTKDKHNHYNLLFPNNKKDIEFFLSENYVKHSIFTYQGLIVVSDDDV